MRVFQLLNLLQSYPPDMEVCAFKENTQHLLEITEVYKGNEAYLPKGKRGNPDVVVLEVKTK